MRALKVVDIGDHDPLAQLNDIAAELRKLHTRVNADTLAMAELLHDVQAHNLVMYEPGYDPEVWKKKPDGTRAAIVDWHKREVGPITPARVTQLISAGAVVTAVTTGSQADNGMTQIERNSARFGLFTHAERVSMLMALSITQDPSWRMNTWNEERTDLVKLHCDQLQREVVRYLCDHPGTRTERDGWGQKDAQARF